MVIRYALLCLTLPVAISFAQTTAELQSPAVVRAKPTSGATVKEDEGAFLTGPSRSRFEFVRHYMAQKSPLGNIGAGTLAMMGDEAAFYVYTIIIKRPPLTAEQTLTVLDMLHSAFAKPELVQNAGHLTPKNTKYLLGMIEKTAIDQRVKERIAAEKTFLETVPTKIVRAPWVITGPVKEGALPVREDFGLK